MSLVFSNDGGSLLSVGFHIVVLEKLQTLYMLMLRKPAVEIHFLFYLLAFFENCIAARVLLL